MGSKPWEPGGKFCDCRGEFVCDLHKRDNDTILKYLVEEEK